MSGNTKTGDFPDVSGSNLEGRKFKFPNDFESDLNITVIAFKMEQTSLIEGWAPSLEEIEKENSNVRFYELPVLSRAYSPIRWWINGGMRAGIADAKSRRRTITLYTAKSAFKNQLKIPNEDTIYVFLVDRSGKILWRSEGEFTEKKNQDLQDALEKNENPRVDRPTLKDLGR